MVAISPDKSWKQLALIDVESGTAKLIPGSTSDGNYEGLALSRNSRLIYAAETIHSSDLWLLKLPER